MADPKPAHGNDAPRRSLRGKDVIVHHRPDGPRVPFVPAITVTQPVDPVDLIGRHRRGRRAPDKK